MKRSDLTTLVIGTCLMTELVVKVFTYDPVVPVNITTNNHYTEVVVIPENIPKQETEPEVVVDRTQDIDLLAHVIYAEAGASWCEPEMRYLVGVVALNRVKSPDFPDTLQGVIYQKGQYECVSNGHINKEYTQECYDIAYSLINDGYDVPEDLVYQSESKQGSRIYKKVQNMYFCRK